MIIHSSLRDRIGAVDADSASPMYLQLADVLRRGIAEEVFKSGQAIPAERDLAEQFGVSRVTVRKAIDLLVLEGLLLRRQGAGTFIGRRVEKQFSKLSSFSEDMASRGLSPGSRWISRVKGTVTPSEALNLGLSPGTPVYRFTRIREAGGSTMALEYSTILGSALADESDVADSLYAALEATGHRPVRALQRLRAVLFNDEQAQLLKIQPGSPGLFIERRGFLADGKPVEITQSWYRGDFYDFVAELSST
jgi:GntR family transcriptional regulator